MREERQSTFGKTVVRQLKALRKIGQEKLVCQHGVSEDTRCAACNNAERFADARLSAMVRRLPSHAS